MKKHDIFILLAFLLTIPSLSGQGYAQLGFARTFDVPVNAEAGPLEHPWVGGMNACQFTTLDIDLDGTRDLLVFDRTGNVIMPFINRGIPDSAAYIYAPEYLPKFPPLHDWVICADYDMDGREDIFTYSVGGMSVYRNVSDTALQFQLMVYTLNSFNYIGYINIFVTDVDYPAIYDIDQDGDLDILSFYILGNYIELHQNMSMEKYGVPDSLDFTVADRCWGRIVENEYNNELLLNVPCPFPDCEPQQGIPYNKSGRDIEHIGSTFLLFDANADNLADAVIGDVDYPNMILTINGGTLDSAHIVSQDTSFPSNTVPIRLVSFPALAYVDIDNDGIRELLVSPFDPSRMLATNYESVWLYENHGQNNLPSFSFVKDAWMQEDMVDVGGGSYPVVVDENADGLPDLLVGNYGYLDSSWFELGYLKTSFRASLALYRNVGTAQQPAFSLITRDYAGLASKKVIGVAPAFGDLDGDGDLDMLVGKDDGRFMFYRNQAGPGQPFNLQFETDFYQSLDVGFNAMPLLFDLTGDSLPDLISGNRKGTLSFMENIGTVTDPVFIWVTDTLGGVQVRDANQALYGYSAPAIYQDIYDSLHLMVGSLSGTVAYYRDIRNINDTFELVTKNLQFLDEGILSAPAIADLDADHFPELLVGNYRGGLSWYQGDSAVNPGLPEPHVNAPGFRVFPNPTPGMLTVVPERYPQGQPATLVITDLTGRLVRSLTFLPGQQPAVDLSGLEAGIYVVSLRFGKGNAASRLVVRI